MRHSVTDAKAKVATAFPGVEFTWYPGVGRSRQKGWQVQWTGGPSEEQVCLAIGLYSTVRHFMRLMTDKELAAYDAEQTRLEPIRKAERVARRAQNKANGIAKAKATRQEKATLRAKLARLFPDTEFTIKILRYGVRLEWRDGPSETQMRENGITGWMVHTETPETPEHRAARIAADRLTRRLQHAKDRAAAIERGRLRRLTAYAAVEAKRNRESAQLSFAFVQSEKSTTQQISA